MKTTCLLFLMMSWATLTHGTGYAAPLRAEPALECGSEAAAFDCGACSAAGKAVAALPHSKARTFGPRPLAWGVRFLDPDGVHRTPEIGEGGPQPAFSSARQPTGTVSGHSAPAPQKANHPKRLPSRRQASPLGNAMNLHQPGSDKSGVAAKSGFIGNGTGKNAFAVRAPSLVRPTAPSFNNLCHRRPNPAVVSGSADVRGRNPAAINGTRMNRKP
jgi:hypothetical protein